MDRKFKLDGKEYEVGALSDQGKATLDSLEFVTKRILELNNMGLLLKRAQNSYIEGLKQEMLSSKAGLLFEND